MHSFWAWEQADNAHCYSLLYIYMYLYTISIFYSRQVKAEDTCIFSLGKCANEQVKCYRCADVDTMHKIQVEKQYYA